MNTSSNRPNSTEAIPRIGSKPVGCSPAAKALNTQKPNAKKWITVLFKKKFLPLFVLINIRLLVFPIDQSRHSVSCYSGYWIRQPGAKPFQGALPRAKSFFLAHYIGSYHP